MRDYISAHLELLDWRDLVWLLPAVACALTQIIGFLFTVAFIFGWRP